MARAQTTQRGGLSWGARALALGLFCCSPPAALHAPRRTEYPSQTVRIIVNLSPGSVADGLARIAAEKLAKAWNQQVIVDNRPGLAGTAAVAKAAPDGYTLLVGSNGPHHRAGREQEPAIRDARTHRRHQARVGSAGSGFAARTSRRPTCRNSLRSRGQSPAR